MKPVIFKGYDVALNAPKDWKLVHAPARTLTAASRQVDAAAAGDLLL